LPCQTTSTVCCWPRLLTVNNFPSA
jgi:hypothetical protein